MKLHPCCSLGGLARCATLAVLLFGRAAAADEEEEEEGDGGERKSRSSDILEVMAWCKEVNDGVDWARVLRLAKVECRHDAADDEPLRIRCSPEGLGAVVEAVRLVLEVSAERVLGCANGLVFLLAVALAYGRSALSSREAVRAQAMLWSSLQENFMLDASIWPVKTFDVLQLFDRSPAALAFPALEVDGLAGVTFLVPRCPPALASALMVRFPGVRVLAGVTEELPEMRDSWTFWESAWDLPTGTVLNRMLETVQTDLVFVVVGAGLPRDAQDIHRLARVLRQRRLLAAGGPLLTEDRIYADFCYRLRLRHYRLGFVSEYEHSVIFDEASAASIRGSWFREVDAEEKDGPCKLCETLPPTFLARSDALRAIGFHPLLDGEWVLLDLAVRASRTPLVEVLRPAAAAGEEASGGAEGGEEAEDWKGAPGRRHTGLLAALCPGVVVREVEGLGAPHLYGRRDMPPTGVAPAAPWFGDDTSALGPALGGNQKIAFLRPGQQAKLFMDANHLREFVGPDGVARRFGCDLHRTNCPVPNWVYRGWAVPPCCKETMRHLLFYIDDVFREVGVRYIITDGVLLGSYKFGGMLDWDADVDLHIHDDDFHRLEESVQHRVKEDGHFLRKHANNNSWLLQANDHNYLLIELNKRSEPWDPERVWQLPVQGRLFPAMEDAHLNLSSWYGMSYFRHRLRHVPEWEEERRPMFCATPYHYNCVDETQVPGGQDCRQAGIC